MKLEIVFKDGRKETFDGVASFNVTEEKTANEECHASDVAQIPTEGKPFEVNPLGIDRSKFEKSMSDQRQEWTRQIIQEAFAEVDKHPERYASAFYTLIPEKKWNGYKTVAELEAYAKDLDGWMANWVEQALEWAQRISNGESWKAICNNADTAKWYRVIRWKNGSYRLVGGSRNSNHDIPASYVPTVAILITESTTLCHWLCLRKSNTVHCYPFLRRQNPKLGGYTRMSTSPFTH